MNIVLFGAGAHSRVIVDIIRDNGEHSIIGYIDSRSEIGSEYYGIKIIGRQNQLKALLEQYGEFGGIIALGDNYSRYLVSQEITNQIPDFQFVNAVSSFTSISPTSKMGSGNVILPGCIVNSEAEIKDHTIINTNSSLEHNCILGNFASLSAGVVTGGYVTFGDFSAMALGVTVFDQISIGKNVVVGSGSLVTKDLEADYLYYGIPAKPVRPRKLDERFL